MGFALVRIDDRLIHGQVMAVWAKALGAKRIVIVDDQVSQDPFLQKVMRLAAPPQIKVDICSISQAREVLTGHDEASTIVLLKTPQTALSLFENGVRFNSLNVGGIGAGPGRKPAYRNISLSSDEFSALEKLVSSGVQVVFKIVPDDRGMTLADLEPKLKAIFKHN